MKTPDIFTDKYLVKQAYYKKRKKKRVGKISNPFFMKTIYFLTFINTF